MKPRQGEQRGVLIDILNYADKQMPQHRFELSLYPWARAYMASASGQGGLLGISWTWRRDEVFDYSEPLFYDEVVIVVRKGHEFNYQSLSDLQGKTLGTVRGASFGSTFDRAHQDGVFSIEGDNGARNRLDQEKNGPAGDAPLPILIDREVLKEQLLNLREVLKV